jgi:SanA protein
MLTLLLLILLANKRIEFLTKHRTYSDITQIPNRDVGLLLGTGKLLKSGYLNRYYINRIQAATDLYKSGKIKYILVSGDNGRKGYDEPSEMKADLIAKGIPADKIYLDYAGFRTFDSVVRSKAIFGQTKLTIISQKFHNERAVYIAKKKGINAVGFNAKGVGSKYGFKTILREKLARVKVFIDLLINKQPKYLGKSIKIG